MLWAKCLRENCARLTSKRLGMVTNKAQTFTASSGRYVVTEVMHDFRGLKNPILVGRAFQPAVFNLSYGRLES